MEDNDGDVYDDSYLVKRDGTLITEEDLLESVAKSEGLNYLSKKTTYTSLYKHPLPVSDKRYLHEDNLRRILSCRISMQGISSITKGDAWTLEEVYMRHGVNALEHRNDTSCLHLAVQLNHLDCVMVLVNIGVDLNPPDNLGYTPLRIAQLNGFRDIEKFLLEHKATTVSSHLGIDPETTVLEIHPEKRGPPDAIDKKKPKELYRVLNTKSYY